MGEGGACEAEGAAAAEAGLAGVAKAAKGAVTWRELGLLKGVAAAGEGVEAACAMEAPTCSHGGKGGSVLVGLGGVAKYPGLSYSARVCGTRHGLHCCLGQALLRNVLGGTRGARGCCCTVLAPATHRCAAASLATSIADR